MWSHKSQHPGGGRAQRVIPLLNGLPIAYAEVLNRWQTDESFRSYFISLLANSTFRGFRWETPPVTETTANRLFEFVLLDEPGLEQAPDEESFANEFRLATSDKSVVVFPNLGKDAVLVVPCPVGPPGEYGHLAAFVRGAPITQQHELWRAVGEAMQARIGAKPVWLSTAGMGVAWLHIRLDSRPKYYGFAEYRNGL